MRTNKYPSKFKAHEMGGAFAIGKPGRDSIALPEKNTSKSEGTDFESTDLEQGGAEIYAQPVPTDLSKRHRTLPSSKSVSNRLKAKRIAETRLTQVSDELQQLAEEIRYLNPLMAEVLDDAWDAAEEAIEFLAENDSW